MARQSLRRTKDKLNNDVEDLEGQLTRVEGGPIPSYQLQMLEKDWKDASSQQEDVLAAFDRCVFLTEDIIEAETLTREKEEYLQGVSEQLRRIRKVLRECSSI